MFRLFTQYFFNPTKTTSVIKTISAQLSNRNGSEEDVKSLVALLKDLGFEINDKEDVFEDKTDIEAITVIFNVYCRVVETIFASCFDQS